jgi:type III pantothenate kinase
MMLLDVGNSFLKWSLRDAGGFSDSGRFAHAGANLPRLATTAWGHIPDPGAIVAANVAGPRVEAEITAWTLQNWQITPDFIRATAGAAGVTNGYASPETLGPDRWAAMVAARRAYPGVVCVIDCGTAITLDVIDGAGLHRGGLIAPGIGIMKHALYADTAGVRPPPGEADSVIPAPLPLLACGTQDAVNNGVLYMARAMLERAIADIIADYGEDTVFVMTGGDAGLLLPLAGRQPHHEPDLVLEGLAILAREPECVT